MLSSTSSSEDHLPRGAWGRTWVFAITLSIVLLTSWDIYWVRRGFEGHIADEEGAWVIARESVGPTSTVLIGTSRIQASVLPGEWARVWGANEPVQLAIISSSPTPILEHIALDESFRGLVVMDVTPQVVFDPTLDGEEESYAMIDAARMARVSPAKRIDARIGRQVSRAMAFRHPALSPGRLIVGAIEGTSPQPISVPARPDRFLEFDFTKLDAEDRRQRLYRTLAGKDAPTSQGVGDVVARLESAATAIGNRGGYVLFVHFPRCGEIRVIEETLYPKAVFWDRLAGVPSTSKIDMEELDEVRRFECHDGSHVDIQDAPVFTRLLANEALARLREAGWRQLPG